MTKEMFVNAMMQEHKTNPDRIVQFVMLALDEMAAYNKGKADMLNEIHREFENYQDTINQINKKFDEEKAELVKQYDLLKCVQQQKET